MFRTLVCHSYSTVTLRSLSALFSNIHGTLAASFSVTCGSTPVSGLQLGLLRCRVAHSYSIVLHAAGDGLDKERIKALGMGAFARWAHRQSGTCAKNHSSCQLLPVGVSRLLLPVGVGPLLAACKLQGACCQPGSCSKP
jgi:hypothetical protein